MAYQWHINLMREATKTDLDTRMAQNRQLEDDCTCFRQGVTKCARPCWSALDSRMGGKTAKTQQLELDHTVCCSISVIETSSWSLFFDCLLEVYEYLY